MENGDFIAQMAQFSTVTGMIEMGNEMKAINDKLDSFSSYGITVFRSFSLVQVIWYEQMEKITEGGIDVPNATTKIQVFFQKENGEL